MIPLNVSLVTSPILGIKSESNPLMKWVPKKSKKEEQMLV